jgi:outer membrane receptor for ferrienterochelin and colicins
MRGYFLIILFLFSLDLWSQTTETDSLFNKKLEEVVVTATRSERKLSNIAVPVTLIQQKTIRQSGSLRLNDILGEQTGLFITQSFGRGVQMQGLSPDYTLILLDGEPLIGRMGGVLDLSRLTVGNIKKIEIVKGPSSSLYGSEALAGVINIITDRSNGRKLQADLRYGRFNTIDASLNAATRVGKLSLGAFVNSNSSEGYSLLPNAVQKTVEPFWRLTSQVNLGYDFSEKTRFNMTARYNYENIQNSITVQNLGALVLSKGNEINKDLNITPSVSHRFNNKLKTTFRGYASAFESQQKLAVKDQIIDYDDQFKQEFYRLENQTDITFNEKLILNAGGGFIKEYVRSNRYDTQLTRRSNQVAYFFLQQEWIPLKKLSLIAGLRYDDNTAYASVWSPKLALQYRVTEKLRVNASVGRGFKAPDFRQLYLNFTNIAAGSYSVFGSLVARDEVTRLQKAGQIDYILPVFEKLDDLKPETSTGLNIGVQYDPTEKIKTRVNFFRNDITNLILTDIIAYKTNGGQIFSYLNISRAFTQGAELEASWQVHNTVNLSGGYQFLMTADKDVLDDIEAGKMFKRDEQTGISSLLTRSEYAGLPGRSKHMVNLKVFYENPGNRWFATTRFIYRSRWGTTDLDGNGIINRDDEFASGFLQVNVSGGMNFKKGIRVMAGVDNLFNYTDPENMPGVPGYNWYVTLSLDIQKLTHKN